MMDLVKNKIDKETLKKLVEKNNLKGLKHFSIFLLIIIFLFLIQMFFFQEKNWFPFLISTYFLGLFLSFLDQTAASHEFQHNNVFKSKRANQIIYKILMFYSLTNWVYNKSSHITHHQHALNEELDDEFSFEKINLFSLFQLLSFNFNIFYRRVRILVMNSLGIFPISKLNIRADDYFKIKIKNCARLIIFLHVTLFLISFYFAIHHMYLIFILTQFVFNFLKDILVRSQHYKLEHNTSDIFKNTKSLETNFFIKFLYWNVNYHVEHHLYPSIPFYNLPKLRKIIGNENIPTVYGFTNFIKILLSDNVENLFFYKKKPS